MKLLTNNYDYADNIQHCEYSLIVFCNYLWQEYVKVNFLIVCVSAGNNSHRAFPFEDKQYNALHEDSRDRKIGKPINYTPYTCIENIANHKHENCPYNSVYDFQNKEFSV